MAAPALNLDLSGLVLGQPRVPDPIYNAFATVQTTINSLGNAHIAADAAIDIAKTTLGAYTAPTAWTPAWTQSGGSPSIGDGTLTGRYCRIGKRVYCELYLAVGSTTNIGSGGNGYRFSLPVTAATLTNFVNFSAGGRLNDLSASRNYEPASVAPTSTTVIAVYWPFATGGSNYTNAQEMTNSAPIVPANGDQMWLSFSYEAA